MELQPELQELLYSASCASYSLAELSELWPELVPAGWHTLAWAALFECCAVRLL